MSIRHSVASWQRIEQRAYRGILPYILVLYHINQNSASFVVL